MRILFISAFYPPYIVGGWEQLLQEIDQHLTARGHTTRVLTSIYGLNAHHDLPENRGVTRILRLESDLNHYDPAYSTLRYRQRTRHNQDQVQSAVQGFKPDVIFIHIMWNLSRGIAWQAEQLCPQRVIYYVANDWPYAPDVHTNYWDSPASKTGIKLPKRALASPALKYIQSRERSYILNFQHVWCVSKAMMNNLNQQAGIPEAQMRVIYNGIDINKFAQAEHLRDPHSPELALLCAGSLVAHKGVHTAIEAMEILASQQDSRDTRLTIAGAGNPEYEEHLKWMVKQRRLEDQIDFIGQVPREHMPELLNRHDILLFPSTWQEPLARAVQEAMAAKLVVVGTPTGGTPEILIHEQTGLHFLPNDAIGLAEQVSRLVSDPDLYALLADNGQSLIQKKFNIDRMIDEIEFHLSAVVGS